MNAHMPAPNYFIAFFGARHASSHPVDGGDYPYAAGKLVSLGIRAGDVMLLYCTRGYPGHHMQAPGIGLVLDVNTGASPTVEYRYLPLYQPVAWANIKPYVPARQVFSSNPLFPLVGGNANLQVLLGGRIVVWP